MDNSFLHRKKLLLVDDEPDLLKMVSDILSDAGFETVLTAATVKEAIITAEKEKPDLMVLDVMLPDGDGFSLMKQLRTFTNVPIIFLTAKDEAADKTASEGVKEQAVIVQKQSAKIKELVQDLNLVSQLEYEMQPLHKEMVRLSKLLRSYVADLLNTGISDSYNIGIKITPDAENAVLECDARLISRAVNNLVQNSMKHNPQGCEVCISLTASQNHLILAVTDNGMGLPAEKLQELEEKPHYMESTDERLDLRHGLGLLIVQQVAIAHNGNFKLTNVFPKGCEAALIFPYIG